MTNAQRIGESVDQEVGQTKSKDDFDLGILPPDLFNLKVNSNSRNHSTVLVDQQTTDAVISLRSTIDKKSLPSKPELTKDYHIVPQSNDELAADISTKSHIDSYKKKPKKKISIGDIRKILASPATLIMILCITSLAIFLVYINETFQEARQFVINSSTEKTSNAKTLSSMLVIDKSENMDPEFLNERQEDSQGYMPLSTESIDGEN